MSGSQNQQGNQPNNPTQGDQHGSTANKSGHLVSPSKGSNPASASQTSLSAKAARGSQINRSRIARANDASHDALSASSQ